MVSVPIGSKCSEGRRHHVDTGRDHGGGVDEGGDGCRAFHGVWKPDVEGGLCGFSHGSGMKMQEDGGSEAEVAQKVVGLAGKELAKTFETVRSAEVPPCDPPEHENADHEAKVTDAVGEEGLLGGICCGVLFIPMSDEEVGAESDQLPEDEHHDEVRGEDDAGHGEHEQRKSTKVSGLR